MTSADAPSSASPSSAGEAGIGLTPAKSGGRSEAPTSARSVQPRSGTYAASDCSSARPTGV
eukprot:scaffold24723_cov131-Isochrysis_galbana.AAC.2